MRPTGILSIYIWFFSSLASFAFCILGVFFLHESTFYYFFLMGLFSLPLIPIHCFLIHMLREAHCNKETIQWTMTAGSWAVLFFFGIQLHHEMFLDLLPFITLIGLAQHFGYSRTFTLKSPQDHAEKEPKIMHPVKNTQSKIPKNNTGIYPSVING